jgi:hypothetical protein
MALSPTELGYAEITSNVTSVSTTYADIAGLSVVADVGGGPVIVTFSCASVGSDTASGGIAIAVLEDGVVLGTAGSIFGTITLGNVSVERSFRSNPAAGSHTYKCQIKRVFGGTATLTADAGGPGITLGPASLSVLQV